MSEIRGILQESTSLMKKFGMNTYSDYRTIMTENTLFDTYTKSLAEGLEGDVRSSFLEMSELMRGQVSLNESSAYGFNPIAPLTMPIFRKFWPMLVTREAVTIIPMDKPDITRSFLRIVATINGNEVEVPNMTTPVSNGRAFGEINNIDMPPYEIVIGNTTSGQTNLLQVVDSSYTPQIAHVNPADFIIVGAKVTGASAGASDESDVELYVEPDDNGNFSFEVACGTPAGGSPIFDTISGNINYYSGIITISSARFSQSTYKVKSITLTGSVSTFEEMNANTVSLKQTYVKFRSEDHELQANWSIQFEQDYKAYFDLDVQTQLVDAMGKLIAMDTDRSTLRKIIRETEKFNPTSCGTGVRGDMFTFDKKPDTGYAFGKKEWNSQIVHNLNMLSAKIYNDTQMTTAPNIIIGNPMDLTIFKNMNDYSFNGKLISGGSYGESPVAGTLADTWKVLSTTLMPIGKMVVMVKPESEDNAVFVYAPYKPLVVSPWPIDRKSVV